MNREGLIDRFGSYIVVGLVGIMIGLTASNLTCERERDALENRNSPVYTPVRNRQAVPKKQETPRDESQPVSYKSFRFQDELADILKHSERIGVEPEMLMAIRTAENGSDEKAYGIIPQGSAKEKYDSDKGYFINGEFKEYKSPVEKQMCWAAWTIRKNADRGNKSIEQLASVYCPVGAENDPNGLNENWEGNVRKFYEEFRGR